MTKRNSPKKFLCFLIAITMILGMIPFPGTIVSAEESTMNDLDDPDSLLALDEQAPAGLATAENPYGYEEGVAFPLSVGNEIIYLGGWDGKTEKTTLNGSSTNDLKNYVKNPAKNGSSYNFDMPGNGPWNWIQAVAFDNSADSTKDNKVLFIGVNKSKKACAWVLDCTTNKISGTLELGSMNWLSDDYTQYSFTSLFNVAAGDFDGDGVDTLFVYAPLDLNSSNNKGCVLYELSYDGSNLSIKNDVSNLLMDQYITDQKSKKYTDQKDTDDTARDKLAVSMQVGDFNGDNIDDLAVLSYSHYRYSGANTNYYSPQLKICYGRSDLKNFNNAKVDQTFTAAVTSGSTLTFPVATSLAASDYNGDGCDDLYVVGVKATATTGSNISKITVSGDRWYLQGFIGNTSSSMTTTGYTTISSNAWFEDGFYDDDYCYGKTMAAGVALSGKTAPAMLFIAGSLYDLSSGTPVHKMTGDYFTTSDQGIGSHTATNTFVQSVIVGNFDNNSAGREQVAFIVGMKQLHQDDYYFKSGFVCGTDFADTTYSDGSTCYGVATKYYCTDIDDEADYIHSDKGDDLDEGLNCLLIAADYDDDGIEAKYLGVNYIYTDPVVNVVLQAAPYFGDITSSGKNATSYSIETNYSHSDTDTDNLSSNIGFAASGSIPLAETSSCGMGIKFGISLSFTETKSTTYSETFEAGSQDVVVVNRVPMLIYQFDIKTKDSSGNWNWTDKTQMELSVPEGPVYTLLSVDDYNTFADTYNAKMESKISDYDKLEKIDPAANWMEGNEGNPYAYNQNGWSDKSINATQINRGTGYALGKTAGKTTVSLSEGTSSTEGFSGYFGFYAKISMLFGPKAIANYGFEINSDYTHSWGNATVTGNTNKSSFTVQDLDATTLLSNGIPEDVLDLYSFTWTCGTWKRNLGTKDSHNNSVKTLFLGYALTNISSPPQAVTDLSAATKDENSITLSWTKPDTPTGWPTIDKYVLYQGVTGTDGSISYFPLSELDSNSTTTTVTTLLDGETIQPDTEYTFMIRTVHNLDSKAAYSAYSNIVKVMTPHPSHTVEFKSNNEDSVSITAVMQGNVPITSGDSISEGNILKITGTAKDGYELTKLTILEKTTEKTKDVTPAEDGTITCYYQVLDDVEFTFYTKKIIKESEVSFTNKVYDSSTQLVGQIFASVNDTSISSGAIISSPVTFKALAEDGYTLTSWNVTVDGKNYNYATNNKTEFTLGLVGENIYVTATFEPTDTIHKTITVEQPSEGGSIALFNKDDIELIPDENGKYDVAYETEVTFKAIPDTGYVVDSWTKDVASQTDDSFKLTITDDITVGIIYRAPIKYKLTYNAEDEHGNFVSTDPTFESGSNIAAGTKVALTAAAADGYRIEKWTITQGSETIEYVMDDACHTKDTKELTINASTAVNVSFVEIEQYSITVKKTGEGIVSIIKGNSLLESGSKVHYMSNILLIAKPNSGWKFSKPADWTATANGFYTKVLPNIISDQNIHVIFEELSNSDDDENPGNTDDSNKPDNDDANGPSNDGNSNLPGNDDNSNASDNNSKPSGKDNNTALDKNNNGQTTNTDTNNKGSKTDLKTSLKTGDNFSLLPLLGILAAIVIICIILKKKKK